MSPAIKEKTLNRIHRLSCLLSGVVFLLGFLGCVGYMMGVNALITLIPGMPRASLLTVISFFWLGLAVILTFGMPLTTPAMLDNKTLKNGIAVARWLCVLITIGIGLFCVGDYLLASHFNLSVMILMRQLNDITPTLMSSVRILISGLALLLFLLWRNRDGVVVYTVNLPGLYLIYTSIFALTGYGLHLPFLYKYTVSVLASVGFACIGLTMLIGTIPFQGSLESLFSEDSKSRGMAYIAIILSFSVLFYGLDTIIFTMRHLNPALLTVEISTLYFMAELVTSLISAVVAVIGLRVVQYRNEALSFAAEEAAFAQALQKSEQKLRRLVESNIVGVIFWKKEGVITEANDAFLTMLGYHPEALSDGALTLECLSPDGQAVLDETSRAALRRHGVSTVTEKQLLARSGAVVDVLMAYALVQDADDSGIALVVDISASKQAEQSALEYQARLLESNRELEQFAAVASHDLQEPLRKIQAFGEMLAPLVPPEGKDYLERMGKAADRMKTLINGLLLLSRVSRKGQAFEPVNLNEVLGEVQDDLQVAIAESEARLEIAPLEAVFADRAQMHQLFQNLISNGLKYRQASQPPWVRIRNQPATMPNSVQVTVEDNGIGIQAEYQEQVFEPFTRLHGTNEYTGSGLGLAICKKIVDRHHGKIWLDSEPGKGSCFYVVLPAVPLLNAMDDVNTGIA